MNLKQAMETDVEKTFINMNEFGEDHEFGNRNSPRALRMIVENDTDNVNPLAYADGITRYRKIVHISSSELGFYPEVGEIYYLDGDLYEATSVEDARGIFKITLEGNV